MNYTFKILVILLVISGCTKEEANFDCIEMSQNDSYTTIPFKKKTKTNEAYTIQFPDNYTGSGLGFVAESIGFEKKSNKNTTFYFLYPCATDCIEYFGSKLDNPMPSSIEHPLSRIALDKKINFCLNEEVEAIFYHNNLKNSKGVLYMKTNSDYKTGLYVDFPHEHLDEVISIIKTIQFE